MKDKRGRVGVYAGNSLDLGINTMFFCAYINENMGKPKTNVNRIN